MILLRGVVVVLAIILFMRRIYLVIERIDIGNNMNKIIIIIFLGGDEIIGCLFVFHIRLQ